MREKIYLYIGLLIAVSVAYYFVDKNAFDRGVRTAESRIIPNTDTLLVEIRPDTVTIERVVVRPVIRVIRDSVNVSVLTYPIDTTFGVPYHIVDGNKMVDSGRTRMNFKGEFWAKQSEYRNLSFALDPIRVQRVFETRVYEKPMPASNYGLWLELAGYNNGTGLSLGLSQFSVKAIHSFGQGVVFDWWGVGAVIRLD